MPNANYAMLMGNVTRDPQLRYTPGGQAVTDLGLAVNRHWTDGNGQKQEATSFFDVTFWGKSAELICNTLEVSKGDPLHIEGRLEQDQWQDKETGQNRSKVKVIGEKFQLLRQNNGQGNQGQWQQRQQPTQGQNQPESFVDDVPY